MPETYLLDEDGNVLATEDIHEWGEFMRDGNARRVMFTEPEELGGVCRVSTVFLGIDHSFGASGPPVLWETLVFDGPMDGEMTRYASRDEALAGHEVMVQRCRLAIVEGIAPDDDE